MIDDYQPILVCIVETHMQKEEEIKEISRNSNTNGWRFNRRHKRTKH